MRLLAVAIFPLVFGVGTANAQQVMKHEPPVGGLRQGQSVLVDNGKCPKGQLQKVSGGYFVGGRSGGASQGDTRTRECVPRP